jgi:transposase
MFSASIQSLGRGGMFQRRTDPLRGGGLCGGESIVELCRRGGTSIIAGRRAFSKPARSGWLARRRGAATSDGVKDLRREASALKEVVADLTLENRLLKKSMITDGEYEA